MKFTDVPVSGGKIVELEPRGDDRGFFARMYCRNEFRDAGIDAEFVNVNNSYSRIAGTLRGMHYQIGEAAEAKLVRCIRGALWDAMLDMRPDSPSFGKWFGMELTAENRRMLYVPRGCAHAILTLSDDTEAVYFASQFYAPGAERGVRWNDPHFSVEWPMQPVELSAKDSNWPDFDPQSHGVDTLRGLIGTY
jgi:dTDP-4-dehydrorhamnose 3,5-epimerase